MTTRLLTGNFRTVYAAGDLHGDHESFRAILNIYEKREQDSILIFLGDYADRGPCGVEIISELDRLLDTRSDIAALKGNHEIYRDGTPFFSPCSLIYEVKEKYGTWERFYQEVMHGFLSKLHIAAVINNVLFVHAGISSKIRSAEDLCDIKNEKDILWSDPSPFSGEHPNLRGAGVSFGNDVTRQVLSSLGLKMVIRSHEPRKAASGPFAEHGGKVITVNSCNSYGERWDPFLLRIDTMNLSYEAVFLT